MAFIIIILNRPWFGILTASPGLLFIRLKFGEPTNLYRIIILVISLFRASLVPTDAGH
jgi:hypothetical protein